MKLSALLTRGWVRQLMCCLQCNLAQLDGIFPTVGQKLSKRNPPDSSKRWYRWARGECYPDRALTWDGSRRVLVIDHGERLAPGSKQVLASPLKFVAVPKEQFTHQIVTRLLLTMPWADTQDIFFAPLSWDPGGGSRIDPSQEQIAVLSQKPSLITLAASIGIWREMDLGGRTWECIAANAHLNTQIENVIESVSWLAEDRDQLHQVVRGIMEGHADSVTEY